MDQDIGWKYILKYCIIGDAGVGKSCILVRFTDNNFYNTTTATLGVEFGSRIITLNNKEQVKVQCWDTAGSERFKSITRSYFRGAAGCLLVYSLSSRASFNNLEIWLNDIRKYADDNLTVLVVANKADIPYSDREVSVEEGENWARERELDFIKVSAKSGDRVDEAFDKSARTILEKLNKGAFQPKANKTSEAVLKIENSKNISSCC